MVHQYSWERVIQSGGNLFFINHGGMQMTTNEFGGVNINAQNSGFAVGSGNTVTNTNSFQHGLEDLTKKLLEELSKQEIPEEQKRDLIETVTAIAENASKEKPNKTLLSGMYSALKTGVDILSKSPPLIEALEKWKDFIGL
jgi:secreted Zn-dependent insulinase-like peptidase